MGTNYYLEKNKCGHCDRSEKIHIGKSSVGWCFSLHVIPENQITNLDDWIALFDKHPIADEYKSQISKDEMLEIIKRRETLDRWDFPPPYGGSWKSYHKTNHSCHGPFGLFRHQIDGQHCIGHGEGTWDLIRSKFS